MSSVIHLNRFKKDILTKEEIVIPYDIYAEDIACLYRDSNGTFITTRQGYTNKVPYNFNELAKYLGI